MSFSLRELADGANRPRIVPLLMDLVQKGTIGTGDLEDLFPELRGRRSQFVIKAVTLWAIHAAPNAAGPLTRHLASYSWSDFDYEQVKAEISAENMAFAIYDQALTMANAILGLA